jgi:hypothetical protein
MSRSILGLKWAKRLPTEWPIGIPRPRPRGFKAFGKRYEILVQKHLPSAERGVWWVFEDANGPGLCQTDFLLRLSSGTGWARYCVLECKHTWTPEGMAQLSQLYLPVLSKALGHSVIGVQICKHIVPWAGLACSSLENALAKAESQGTPSTLHWRGFGPLISAEGVPGENRVSQSSLASNQL